MGPDEELSDEAPELADEAGSAPDAVEESGVEFAAEGADVAMAGEAPDEDEYAMDESAPKADLSNELAEDAGDSASYGFEAARETARFVSSGDSDPDLTEASGVADDSDKYRIIPGTDDGPAPSFAEEVAGAVDQDAAYDPEPASDAPDESAYASHFDGVDSGEELATDSGTDLVDVPAVADEAPADPEEPVRPEPVRAEPVRQARAAAPPKPAPEPAPPAPGGPDDRPGQVRRSAIDEMFARAAELKNKKKKP